MHLPRLNTDCIDVSHTHPSHTQLPPRILEQQRVRSLVERHSINVQLRGLPHESAASPSDVLAPKLRQSPFNEQVTASHLDVVECWKGLSHSQAAELVTWYRFLNKCLQAEVRDQIYRDLIEELSRRTEPVDEVYLLPLMLRCLQNNPHRIIDIGFVDLIDSMMSMYHDEFPNLAAATSSSWSNFSGGLSSFLQNFLRLQDCFVSGANGVCLLVDIDFVYANSTITATGHVIWHQPEIRFLNLLDKCTPGQEYRITPFVLNDLYSPVSPLGSGDYVDQINYTLPQQSMDFGWDPIKHCFKSTVPNHTKGDTGTFDTVLCATIVTPFPGDVRFERQSRWSIKLDVVPAETGRAPPGARGSIKLKRSFVRSLGLATDNSIKRDEIHKKVLRLHSRVQDKAMKIFESPMLQKRKVSKPELVDACLDTKRRRRDSVTMIEDRHLYSSDKEQHESWSPELGLEEDIVRELRGCATTIGHGDKQSIYPSTGSPHTWIGQNDTPISPPDSGTSSAGGYVSDEHAIDNRYSLAHQQQIQQNFREFAERKLFKEAGLISPVSDGDRRAFESIFLDDWEACSPATEDTGDMDTVMSEV